MWLIFIILSGVLSDCHILVSVNIIFTMNFLLSSKMYYINYVLFYFPRKMIIFFTFEYEKSYIIPVFCHFVFHNRYTVMSFNSSIIILHFLKFCLYEIDVERVSNEKIILNILVIPVKKSTEINKVV